VVMGDLVREVDVAVVGGGPGGYSAAFRCAELGLEAVVVDAAGRLGGVCLYEGCIPSKALLHVAEVIHQSATARDFGVDLGPPRIALDVMRQWKAERVVGRLARGLAATARDRGVEVLAGRGVFEDSRTLRVDGDSAQRIRFGHAVIATGSVPAGLPGVSLSGERLMDSTAALDLGEVPERLLVVGGGYIGLELGQVYAALGSRVTLVEMTDGLLPGVDRDLVQPLERRIRKLFAAIALGTKVADLRESGAGVEARLAGGDTVEVDRVLVAVGRRAWTEDLGLAATRVRPDGQGAIAVDERGRTGDPRIFAVGDVTGEPMLAHRAMRQGKVVAEVIAGRASSLDNLAVPAVVFTDPEVAWCGLTESGAERLGRPVEVARVPWGGSGRAASLGRIDGLTKILADPETGRVLGVGAVGSGAGELIAEGALAIETALLAEDLAVTIHAHPTLSETLMEAAERLLRGR
jgi:dihydrolipoamide dehydrogenase